MKGRCLVRSKLVRLLVVLLCLTALMSMAVCIADDVTEPLPGEPNVYPPDCNPLVPTPATLGDIAVMLVTGALATVF
jgi:hypothetical protein